ncbi:unnamed protein product, partial [marine sediment metagenome]
SDASIYLEKGKSFLDNAEYDDAIKELEKEALMHKSLLSLCL